MQKIVSLKIRPSQSDASTITGLISDELGVSLSSISGFHIIRSSLDARNRPVLMLSLQVFIDEPFQPPSFFTLMERQVRTVRRKAIVIGAGPAGLFAALKLIEHGVKPIILERGKDVRSRRRDLAMMNREGIVNPDSNYCFGEGGAGTYSDGKLYTRSKKRGDVNRILSILHQFGADARILSDAHPHIGTNKLPGIITAIRKFILDCGGEYHFDQRVIDLHLAGDKVSRVQTQQASFEGDAVLLATGHSARDIFRLLHQKKVVIEAKPFALGVRVEHPQPLIDSIQYRYASGTPEDLHHLPPASYSLVKNLGDRSVFSFCMCPGGIIAPASTNNDEVVVNGWSPSRRNNPYANSGIVVEVRKTDLSGNDVLAGIDFQSQVERRAFELGGGKLVAPSQRMIDFTRNILSPDLPPCSYLPGIRSAPISTVLPEFISSALRIAFKEFGKTLHGYFTNEAVVVATESRTSSPVRIPRNERMHHPQILNLYPCGEGAGYAGGIVSAAMDGERVAQAICLHLKAEGDRKM